MKNLLFSLVFILFASCSTVTVENDYNKTVDFSAFKTYAWMAHEDLPGEEIRINNPLVKKSVKQSVDNLMSRRGYVRSDKSGADFLIAWFGAVDTKIRHDDIQHFYGSYGYSAALNKSLYSEGVDTSGKPREYKESTLIIDILDAAGEEVLWRGTGTEQVRSDMTETQIKGYVDQSVRQTMKNFPAASK